MFNTEEGQDACAGTFSTESDMNAAIAWLLPRASAKSVADIDTAL
jgi:hypothetical protein